MSTAATTVRVGLTPPVAVTLVPGPRCDQAQGQALATQWAPYGPVTKPAVLVQESPGVVGVGVDGACAGYLPSPVPATLLADITAATQAGALPVIDVTVTTQPTPSVTAHLAVPAPSALESAASLWRSARHRYQEHAGKRAEARSEALTQAPRRAYTWDICAHASPSMDLVDRQGRITLYVMDQHHRNIAKLVRAYGDPRPVTGGEAGAFAAWGELVPEPTNEYDPEAIVVRVDGRNVGYLSLGWKSKGWQQIKRADGKKVLIPVAVRTQPGRKPRIWCCRDIQDAIDYCQWMRRKDWDAVAPEDESQVPAFEVD